MPKRTDQLITSCSDLLPEGTVEVRRRGQGNERHAVSPLLRAKFLETQLGDGLNGVALIFSVVEYDQWYKEIEKWFERDGATYLFLPLPGGD